MACFLLGACGLFLLSSTALAHQMAAFGPKRREGNPYWPPIIGGLFRGKPLASIVALILAGSGVTLWPGIVEFVRSGHVSLHWSRLFVGGFGLLLAAHTVITAVLLQVVAIWKYERDASAQASREAEEQTITEPEGETHETRAA
jgi:hypothetical protein